MRVPCLAEVIVMSSSSVAGCMSHTTSLSLLMHFYWFDELPADVLTLMFGCHCAEERNNNTFMYRDGNAGDMN